jgi:hypothetical protein
LSIADIVKGWIRGVVAQMRLSKIRQSRTALATEG